MTADIVFNKGARDRNEFRSDSYRGGHDPRQLSLDYLLPLMRRLKKAVPHAQLSLFTAAEIEYMAKRHRLSYPDMITALKDAGLDNVNGGGAEILPKERARRFARTKHRNDWLALHEELHRQESPGTRRCSTGT